MKCPISTRRKKEETRTHRPARCKQSSRIVRPRIAETAHRKDEEVEEDTMEAEAAVDPHATETT